MSDPAGETPAAKVLKERSLEDFAERLDFGKILRGILRRLWVIILCALLFALASSYLAHRLSKRFVSSAYLLYEEDTSKSVAGVFPLTRISKASAVEMVLLPSNLNAVRSILGLQLTEKQLAKLIEVVPPTNDSNLINIRVTADSPSLAIDIANTLAGVVVKNTKEYTKRQLNTAYEYYKTQGNEIRDKLSGKIKEISQFQKDHASFEFGADGSVAVRSFAELEQRRQAALESYNSQVIQYENLRREAERIPDQIVKYTEIENPLRQRLIQAEFSLIEAKTRYAPENPRVKTIEDEVSQLKQRLKEPGQQQAVTNGNPNANAEYQKNPLKEQLNLELLNLRGKLRSAQKLKEDIEAELAKQSQALHTLPEEQGAFNRLLNSRDQLQQELAQSQVVLTNLEAMTSAGKSGIEIYQNAEKSQPNDSLFVQLLPLLGFLFGSACGTFLVLAIELGDKHLRTIKEVESLYSPPCLTVIPEFRFFSQNNGEKQFQYFIRVIEEEMEHHVKEPRFSLAIISSQKGEGKSTLVFFLTRYLQQLGKRCLVIEGDASTPIEPKTEKSLEDYLNGKASLEAIIRHQKIDSIKATGASDMKELLKNEKLKELLKELKSTYDIILIDCPGVIESNYAANLAAYADHSLFVVASTLVPRSIVDLSLKELDHHHVKPMGIILNRALRIYIDDVRINTEVKRTKIGLITRLKHWMRKG